jgi:hypothetical protein
MAMKEIAICVLLVITGWATEAIAVPITDTISVDGKEWAQVDLLVGLFEDDMSAVCPVGFCGIGKLNGFDMQGWTRASVEDMYGLFNYYIGADILGSAQSGYADANTPWAPTFFSDGWRPTKNSAFDRTVTGLTRTMAAVTPSDPFSH